MNVAPEPAAACAPATKPKPPRKERPPKNGVGIVNAVITTSKTMEMNVVGSSNEAPVAKARNRKKKLLKGQLPAYPQDGVDERPRQPKPQKNTVGGELKKVIIMKREEVKRDENVPALVNPTVSDSASTADERMSRIAVENAWTQQQPPPSKSTNNATVQKPPPPTQTTAPKKPKGTKASGKLMEVASRNPNVKRPAEDAKPDDQVKESQERPREPINEEVLPRLALDLVLPLRKKNPRFAAAVYFCRLCNCHINTLKFAETHMKTAGHLKAKEEYYLIELLESIPWPPTEAHCTALNALMDHTIVNCGRSPADVMQCFELANWLTNYFQTRLHPGCIVRLYGSSATGFALKTSNVNLELIYPAEYSHAWALTSAHALLAKDYTLFTNVVPDFEAKWPYIKFCAAGVGFWPELPVDCILSVCNTQAFEISLLMLKYARHFPRLVGLIQFCRYWARTCRLDDVTMGGLPPYAFDLMLVHYLQQRHPPALPVFHEMDAFKGPGTPSEAWYRFCIGDNRSFTSWPSLMKEDEWNLAELWLGFLKYYTLDFDMPCLVVNIRSSAPVTRAEKDWRTSRRLGVEDPFLSNKNVAQMTQNMFDYLMNCFRMTYKYFIMPQTAAGPLLELDSQFRLVIRDVLPALKQRRSYFNGGVPEAPPSIGNTIGVHEVLSDLVVTLQKEKSVEKFSPVLEHQPEPQPESSPELPPGQETDAECDQVAQRRYGRQELLTLHDENHQWNPNWNRNYDAQGLPLIGLKHAKCAVRMARKPSKDENGEMENDCAADSGACASALTYISTRKGTADGDSGGMQWDQRFAGNPETECRQSLVGEESVPGCMMPQRPALISESSEISDADYEERCAVVGHGVVMTDVSDTIAEAEEDASCENGDYAETAVAAAIRESGGSGPEASTNGLDVVVGDDGVVEVKEPPTERDRTTAEEKGDVVEIVRRKRRQVQVNPEFVAAAKKLLVEDFCFVFTRELLTDGKVPTILCTFCNVLGHNAKKCPEKQLPPIVPLPPTSPTYSNTMCCFLNDVWSTYTMTARRLNWQEIFRMELEALLRNALQKDVRLQLFGSSCNGFGFVRSDLDLCLTFGESLILPRDIDPLHIIKLVAKALRSHRDYRDIQPVTKAKVPIVRFFHLPSKLDGDISLYNCLALRNTQLLRLYSNIDSRVRALGYIVKVFAKYCDIGDASRGSLSSYAYVIMMLHYLQHTQPPVIPILQEIHDQAGRRPILVDGWDTYFFADLRRLPYVWPFYDKNKESIYDLWLGFLRYYTEVFNASTFVIQMRRSEPLTKFEKLWSEKPLAIEDPFDLNHNLAAGLSWRMYVYIMKVFIQAREVFGHPRHEKLLQNTFGYTLTYESLERYFFDIALRQKEPPPRDRVCKFCGHVGHFVETCPEKKSNQKKAALEEKDDEELENDAGPSKPVESRSK